MSTSKEKKEVNTNKWIEERKKWIDEWIEGKELIIYYYIVPLTIKII